MPDPDSNEYLHPASASGRKWSRVLFVIIGAVACIYLTIVAWIYFKQEDLIFHPVLLPADFRSPFADVTEEKITVPGAELSALHLQLPNPKGVVFFLHGNSGNLSSWFTSADLYRQVNYDLFIVDYRGYGRSTGRIESETQLHDDVRAAWQHIAKQYEGKKIIVYGRSLGSGLAARLASDIQPDLTILVSAYSSLSAIGQQRYPWLPESLLNRYPMPTQQWLPLIKTPVLLIHGDHDTVIPFAQSQILKNIRPTSDLVVIPGAAHNDIQKFPLYEKTLTERATGL